MPTTSTASIGSFQSSIALHVPRRDWFPEMQINNSNAAVTQTDVGRRGH
jgi:hypothetical protein